MKFNIDDFIGRSKQEARRLAESLNMTCRIAREDHKIFMLSRDLQVNRINFEVKKGIITQAGIG